MVIETKRLILRPFLEGDAADVYEYLKEPAVNCFACRKLHSLDEARESIGQWVEFYNVWRPHQALDDRTPLEHFMARLPEKDLIECTGRGADRRYYLKTGALQNKMRKE